MIKVIEEFQGAKRLPRHEITGEILNVFHANGNKYYILSDLDAFPIDRWALYGNYSAEFLSGMDFQSMYDANYRMRKMLNDYVERRVSFDEILLYSKAIEEQMLKMTEVKYDSGLYLATLFINREGEDIAKWTQAMADDKISDWAAEGFATQDFLLLAGHYASAYRSELLQFMQALSGAESPKIQSAEATDDTATQTVQ